MWGAACSWLRFLWRWFTFTVIEDLVETTLGPNVIDACLCSGWYERHLQEKDQALACWGWCLELSRLLSLRLCCALCTGQACTCKGPCHCKTCSLDKKNKTKLYVQNDTELPLQHSVCCVLHSSITVQPLEQGRLTQRIALNLVCGGFCVQIFCHRYRV